MAPFSARIRALVWTIRTRWGYLRWPSINSTLERENLKKKKLSSYVDDGFPAGGNVTEQNKTKKPDEALELVLAPMDVAAAAG